MASFFHRWLGLCFAVLLFAPAISVAQLQAATVPDTEIERYLGIFADFYTQLKSGDLKGGVTIVEDAIQSMLDDVNSDEPPSDEERRMALAVVAELKQASGQDQDRHLHAFAEVYRLLLRKVWDDDSVDYATRDQRAQALLEAAINGVLSVRAEIDADIIAALQTIGATKGFYLVRAEGVDVWTFRFGAAPANPPERATLPPQLQDFLAISPFYWLGAVGLVWGLWLLARRRSLAVGWPSIVKRKTSGSDAATAVSDSGLSSQVWPSAAAFSLDRAECASILSFPLLAVSRATFLGSVVLNVAIVPLLIVADIFRIGIPVSTFNLFLIVPSIVLFFLVAWVLKRLELIPLTIAATLASLSFGLGALSALYVMLDHLTRKGPLLTALYAALLVWFGWAITRGYWALVYLPEEDRRLLRSADSSVLSREALADYSGIPYIARYLTSNRRLVLAFFVLSTLMLSVFVVSLLSIVTTGIHIKDSLDQMLVLVLSFCELLLLLALGKFFERLARTNAWSSLDHLTAADPRPPILFLRAFKDDHLTVPAPQLGYLSRLIALGLPSHSLDTILVEEGVRFGPVVALGNPRDSFPPYGAARGYFANKDWKEAVTDLAKRSQLIILCLEETESVDWEIDHVIRHGHLHKVLFIVPPTPRPPSTNTSVVQSLIRRLRAIQPNLAPPETHHADNIVALAINERGEAECLQSSSGSGLAYRLALRRFIDARMIAESRPVAGSTLENEKRFSLAKSARFTTAPLLAANPPQVSALQVGTLAVLAIFVAQALAGAAGRVAAMLIASYALVRLVGGLARLRAALTSVVSVAAGVAVIQGADWLAPFWLEPLRSPLSRTEFINMVIAVAAAAAGAYALGARLVMPRLSVPGFPLGGMFISGCVTAIGLLFLLHYGPLQRVDPEVSIGLLNTLRDASVAWLFAVALGLPVFYAAEPARAAPWRRLSGLKLLDDEARRLWTKTSLWLLGSVIIPCVIYAALDYLWVGPDDVRSYSDSKGRELAVACATIAATVCLWAGALAGLRPRCLFWVLSTFALFLAMSSAMRVVPYAVGQFATPLAGFMSLLLGALLARKDWQGPDIWPRLGYIPVMLLVAWITLRATLQVLSALVSELLRPPLM